MVFEPDDRMKKKMTKNGSVLQFMYSAAGAGKGLIAMGIMLIVIGLGLGAALFNVMGKEGAIKLAVVIVIPSILLAVLGYFMQQKKEKGWVEAYRNTGLTEQEVLQADREFRQPGTILFSTSKDKDTNSLKQMGFITANFVKFPGTNPCIFRMEDMVACFYTKKMLCEDGGYNRALVAYGLDGEWSFLQVDAPEKASLEIVKAIGERNPRIITDHYFVYEGKEYDALRGLEDVIRLHKQVYGKM